MTYLIYQSRSQLEEDQKEMVWGGKATASAFEIVCIPLNKFKAYDFNSGWNPIPIPPTSKVAVSTKLHTVRSSAERFLFIVRKPTRHIDNILNTMASLLSNDRQVAIIKGTYETD